MIMNLSPGDTCIKCFHKLTENEIDILTRSSFAQSWCLRCVLKWALSIDPYKINEKEKFSALRDLERLGVQLPQ